MDKRVWRAARPGVIGVAAWMVFCGVGCGGDDQSGKVVPSMIAKAPTRQAPVEDESAANRAPVVEAVDLQPANPIPGRVVRASARASDPDGDAMRLKFVWRTSSGRMIGEGRTLDTSGLDRGDRLELVVTATDGEASSPPFVRSFEMAKGSQDVALVAIEAEDGTKPGALLEAVVETSDDEAGDYEIVYEWKVNGERVGQDDELDTTPFLPGDTVVLSAHLDLGDRTTRPVRSRPLRLSQVEAPQIVSKPEVGMEGGVFRYQVRATSEEPDARLAYELLEGPEGMTVDASTGLVVWRPGKDQRGAFKIEVAAKDQWGAGSAQAFRIQVDPPTAPPASPR